MFRVYGGDHGEVCAQGRGAFFSYEVFEMQRVRDEAGGQMLQS